MVEPVNKAAPFQFVLKSLMIAAVVMWFLAAVIQPMMEEKTAEGVTREKILEYTAKISPIAGDEIVAKVRESVGKPLMLMTYASWCGVCRASMPYVMETLRETSAEKRSYNVLMLSLDRKADDMSRYLLKNGFTQDFTPYIFRSTGLRPLNDYLHEVGGNFDSRIPYFAFFNAEGKLVHESTGGMDKEMLHEALLKAL